MLKRSLLVLQQRPELYKAKLFFYVFLASLTMFFAAAVIMFAVIRTQAFQPIRHEYVALKIPWVFWLSTVVLILVSIFLHRAVWLIRREKVMEYQKWLRFALHTAVVFLFVQFLGMAQLIVAHTQFYDGTSKVFGLTFTLAFVHALHVLGGIVLIGYILWQAGRGKYDHEYHYAVENCASYWHFMDIVWIAMLVTFVVTN